MAKLNTAVRKSPPIQVTHEGAPAKRIDAEAQLRRSVMACMLWENEFYEDGEFIAKRITDLVGQVPFEVAAGIAAEARGVMKLRHAPLLIAAAMPKHFGAGTADTIAKVIQRADELAEIIAITAKINGVTPDKVKPVMAAQLKKGIAKAFRKFDEYQLAKYNRKGLVTLKDALLLSHAKPKDAEQAALWKRLIEDKLATPDTWEVALSGGASKRETFERLLQEKNLGYLALLRNLRNMSEAGVDDRLVREAILAGKGANRVLPFRFVAAARHAQRYERELDQALLSSIAIQDKLPGMTVVLVDVSGSMDWAISHRSDLTRMDAAAALASVVPADHLRVFTFSMDVVEVPPRQGMAGVDAVIRSQPHSGTHLGAAVNLINNKVPYDRLIVITDEQSHDRVPDPKGRGYMINVASNQNGVGYGKWVHIDGFSEAVINYIRAYES